MGTLLTDYNDLYCLFTHHAASHRVNITMSAFVIGETTNNKHYSKLLKTHVWIVSSKLFKGAVCRIELAVELGIAVQIQNIGDVFFHPAPPPLTWHTGRNKRKWWWMKLNMLFSANWQPGVPKYNWVNWQWEGFTNHNKHTLGRNTHFQRRITDLLF